MSAMLIECWWLCVVWSSACVWNPAVFSVSLGVWEIDASLCSIRVSGETCTLTRAIGLVLKIDRCLHPCRPPEFNLPVMMSCRPPWELLWGEENKKHTLFIWHWCYSPNSVVFHPVCLFDLKRYTRWEKGSLWLFWWLTVQAFWRGFTWNLRKKEK